MMSEPPAADGAVEFPSAEDLRDAWRVLSSPERAEGFRLLPRTESEEYFGELDAHDQAELIAALPPAERRSWMRLLAPDDAADVLQATPEPQREALAALLDDPTRKEVTALLA